MRRKNRKNGKDIWLLILFTGWGILLIVRLVELQVFQHNFFSKRKITQTRAIEKITPRRGTIYDRNGVVLAISVSSHSAFVRKELNEKELNMVKAALHLSEYQIKKMLKRWREGKKFTWLKRKLSEYEYKKLQSLGIKNIEFLKEPKRIYPQGRLAAHVLGGVNIDNKGTSGIESSLQKYIGGIPGEREILLDALGYPIDIKTLKPMVPGKDIRLTLDAKIQHVVETALSRRVREARARRGAVVVLNTKGEILAMASYPFYDPNRYSEVYQKNRGALRNFALSLIYPPGSTMKFIDMAIAFQLGKLRMNEKIFCENGKIRSGRKFIRDHIPFGLLTVPEILIHSSNVGAIKIVRRIPEEKYYQYLLKFGLGRKTGVELPGETGGILRRPERWNPYSRDYIAIGQEIATSPLQMAAATLVIATSGVWIQPHITFKEVLRRKILSDDVVLKVRKMMKEVVERGTGIKASLGWIGSGGKTGTAEKIVLGKKIGYTPSFVGFLPYSKPKYVVTVVIDEPRDKYYGAEVAAPLFREIGEYLLMNSDLYPSVVMQ